MGGLRSKPEDYEGGNEECRSPCIASEGIRVQGIDVQAQPSAPDRGTSRRHRSRYQVPYGELPKEGNLALYQHNQQLCRDTMAAWMRSRDTIPRCTHSLSSSHNPSCRSTANSGIFTVPSKHHAPSPCSTLTPPITTLKPVRCSGTRRRTFWVKLARSAWMIVVWVTDRRRRVEGSFTRCG